VVLNGQTDQLMANPATRILVEDLMGEVAQGAAACGCEITPAVIAKMLAHTEAMTPYLTSMKLDYDRRQPLELEAIVGNPLRFAQRGGAILPKITMLHQQLQFLDTANLRS